MRYILKNSIASSTSHPVCVHACIQKREVSGKRKNESYPKKTPWPIKHNCPSGRRGIPRECDSRAIITEIEGAV